MTKDWNCYVGAVAKTAEEARQIVIDKFHGLDDNPSIDSLVHTEQAEDPEEQPTFIFRFWADSSEQEEGDWLHDLYDLPELKNAPCEIA